MTRLLMTADVVGGVWTYALDLARALAPLGYQTSLAVLGPMPGDSQRAAAARVPGLRLIETGLALDWLADGPGEVRAAGRAIATLARSLDADLVQLNQPALAAEAMPVPAVAAVHSCVATWWRAAGVGAMPESFAWQTELVHQGLARADAIVCPSAAMASALVEAYRLPVAPQVVHNGRTQVPATAGAAPATAPGDPFALTAGRLWDRGKDVATLDRMAARLAVPVKAAGSLSGPDGASVVLDHMIALGQLDEERLARCYAARPVFVSAALYEPFGLAVLEAAQAGCALVLSDIPTFRELWSDVALFVAPADEAGFAAAVARLIAEPAPRLARGELARRRGAGFTAEAMAGGMAAIWRSVAQRAAAA